MPLTRSIALALVVAAPLSAQQPLATVPVELHAGHVYLRVAANGATPAWFILDTGASTTLDSAATATLGRPTGRAERGGGGGEQAVDVRFADVALALADSGGAPLAAVAVPRQRVAVVSLSAISRAEGRPVAGILGGSFFGRYAVVIDYARAEVAVYRPGTFRAPAGWRALALQREDDLVFARGAVTTTEGAPAATGWYEIDTGGGHALILNAPFVRQHRLAAAGAGAAAAMLSIGGGATAVRGQVAAFRFADTTLTTVATLFSQATAGLFASDEFDGSVGGGLLQRFSAVAFDYGAKRMWVGPPRAAP